MNLMAVLCEPTDCPLPHLSCTCNFNSCGLHRRQSPRVPTVGTDINRAVSSELARVTMCDGGAQSRRTLLAVHRALQRRVVGRRLLQGQCETSCEVGSGR